MLATDLMPIVAPCCEQYGAHLIDILLRGRQGKPVIELFIDAENGVTSDVCTAVSREVEKVFEKRSAVEIPQSYTLIVSSPGIDRPLKFSWQYKKHVGRNVAVRVKVGTLVTETIGKLLSVSDEAITLEIGKERGQTTVRFSEIADTVVKAPW